MISTCAQTKARSSTLVTEPSPNRPESALDTGDEPAGHSFRPSAIRVACQSSSVDDDPGDQRQDQVGLAQVAALEARRALHLADRAAAITPASTSTAKTSTSSANQPWWPSHGSVASRSTAPISAIRIVGKRTRKPQKIAAWIRPGTEPLEQLALAEHDLGLVAGAPRQVAGALRRLAHPHEADDQARPPGEQGAADGERRREGERSGQDAMASAPFAARR